LGKDIGPDKNLKQMSDDWVQHVKTYFDDADDTWKILEKVRLQQNGGNLGISIEKLGLFIEGNGIINVLKL
jgi:hypothetical protein